MNAIEYQTIINALNLAKQILTFYADEKNYEPKLGADALILVDKGHQAKYALQTIEQIVEPDYKEMEQNIRASIKQEHLLDHQKMEIEKALKSMTSIVDDVKKQYDELLESGLFFEKFPELSGNWETDKYEFTQKLYE